MVNSHPYPCAFHSHTHTHIVHIYPYILILRLWLYPSPVYTWPPPTHLHTCTHPTLWYADHGHTCAHTYIYPTLTHSLSGIHTCTSSPGCSLADMYISSFNPRPSHMHTYHSINIPPCIPKLALMCTPPPHHMLSHPHSYIHSHLYINSSTLSIASSQTPRQLHVCIHLTDIFTNTNTALCPSPIH